MTGKELHEKIKAREEQLRSQADSGRKHGHIIPCGNNFTYSNVSKGSKEGLEMILSEIKSE